MVDQTRRIGWIGMGRMGFPMAERLLKAGNKVSIYNRTKSKAEPLAASGATIIDKPSDLAGMDVVFAIVSEGKDLIEVLFGPNGAASGGPGKVPKIIVDCSSISVEESAEVRKRLAVAGSDFVAAPVSGNGKCVKAGKLSSVMSGPEAACLSVKSLIESYAPRGVTYVGEGELSRICKIAHNVMLGVVIQNLCEITVLANKAGVPREAFLKFMNNSVMGSIFTAYKSPALVNLDWTTTFTPKLLRKDLDLGLDLAHGLDVSMPVTAATREALQQHMGLASQKPDPAAYLAADFATLLETIAAGAGLKLKPENKDVPSGLES